jgi:hypothetical protein
LSQKLKPSRDPLLKNRFFSLRKIDKDSLLQQYASATVDDARVHFRASNIVSKDRSGMFGVGHVATNLTEAEQSVKSLRVKPLTKPKYFRATDPTYLTCM